MRQEPWSRQGRDFKSARKVGAGLVLENGKEVLAKNEVRKMSKKGRGSICQHCLGANLTQVLPCFRIYEYRAKILH